MQRSGGRNTAIPAVLDPCGRPSRCGADHLRPAAGQHDYADCGAQPDRPYRRFDGQLHGAACK